MLIGMDNQGWMPVHVESSQLANDNLRLMQSVLSPRCILMGSVRMPEQGRGTQGGDVSTPVAIKQPGGRRLGVQPRSSVRAMMTMMLLMMAGLPECVAFRAFDCNSQSSQIEQYSLLDPEPCGNMEKVHAIADQEGAIGASHQVHGDADDQDGVLRLAEPLRPQAIREVSRPDHHRAGRLQEGGQDGALQAQWEGAPV